MTTLILTPPSNKSGLVYRDSVVTVFEVHAAYPDSIDVLRGHRFDAIVIAEDTVIGQSTEAMVSQIIANASMTHTQIIRIGVTDVD